MRILTIGAALLAAAIGWRWPRPRRPRPRPTCPAARAAGTSVALKAKPRKCDFTYLHNPLALAGRAAGLEWRGWGRRVTRARGTGISLHADANGNFDRFPARVRLSRRVTCGGHRVYTRVTFFDGDDRRTWSVPPGSC